METTKTNKRKLWKHKWIVDFQEFSPEGTGEATGGAAGGGGQGGQDALGYDQDQGDEAGYIDDEELGNINGFDDDN